MPENTRTNRYNLAKAAVESMSLDDLKESAIEEKAYSYEFKSQDDFDETWATVNGWDGTCEYCDKPAEYDSEICLCNGCEEKNAPTQSP